MDIKQKFREYRENPLLCVKEVMGANPTKQQTALLLGLSKPGSKISVRSGHGTGKTTTLAWAILWFISLFDDVRIPCTAPSAHQLSDVLWAELNFWHSRMNPWFRDQIRITKDKVTVVGAEKSRFAIARTARKDNPDALQGLHSKNMLFIIEEASGVDEKIFEVARGALSTENARVIMAANPTKNTGYFYNSFHKNSKNWLNLHFSCLDSPLVSNTYIEEMAYEFGDESDIYKVRVLGDFPGGAIEQLISMELVDEAEKRIITKEQFSFAPKILGVDCAWYGDDKSAITLRQGIYSHIVGVWSKIDNMTLADKVIEAENKYQTDATFVDIGWGAGIVDRMRQLGRDPIPVNFGSSAHDKEKYTNLRAEMWHKTKKWLESGGCIETNQSLREDLLNVNYIINETTGKFQLERKKAMKTRGVASPDIGDSLAITFAYEVVPKQYEQEIVMAQTEYEMQY